MKFIHTAFLFVMLALSSSFAQADATLTFALTGAGAANTSRAMIVADTDGARILAWAKAVYGPVAVPPVETNPLVCTASPIPAQCLPTTRPLTNAEAITAVFDGLFAGLRANVKNFEASQAARAASDGVVVIVPK